jgi:membrane protease YdiL (CAAX protease family)
MTEFDADASVLREPGAPTRPPRPGRDLLIDLIIAGVGFFLIALIVPAIFIVLGAAQEGIALTQLRSLGRDALLRLIGAPGIFAMLAVQNAFFVAIPLVRVRWLRREPAGAIGLVAPRPLRLALFGVGLGVVVIISNVLLGLLFARLGIRQNQAEQYPLFAGDYLGQLVFFLGAAVLAPIGEEFLFRGYVFNTLRRLWGLAPAFLLSALLFSLAHSLAATEGVIGLLVPAFAMGLLLAWGMQRTGSLLPCVIAHGMNNGLALIGLLVCVNNPGMCPAGI